MTAVSTYVRHSGPGWEACQDASGSGTVAEQRKDTRVGWRLEKPPEDESWVETCEGEGQSWVGWQQPWQGL